MSDKKQFIESMKKIIFYVSNNNQKQTQVFKTLSKNYLVKLFQNLFDDNEYLRRISGLLLCQLLYQNICNQQNLMKLFDILPQYGRIILNKFPDSLQKNKTSLQKCMKLLKSQIKNEQSSKICWMINLDRNILQLQFLDYKKYSSFTFLDPSRNLFGFTFINSQFKLKNASIEKNIRSQQLPNKGRQYISNSFNKVQKKTSNQLLQSSPKQNNFKVLQKITHSSQINSKAYLSSKKHIKIKEKQKSKVEMKSNSIANQMSNLYQQSSSPSIKYQIFQDKKYQKQLINNQYGKIKSNLSNNSSLEHKFKQRSYIQNPKKLQKFTPTHNFQLNNHSLYDNVLQKRLSSQYAPNNQLKSKRQKTQIEINDDSFYRRVKDILYK